MWTSERFNERFFLFIKRALPGMVLYVRANTLLELMVAADTSLLLLTPRVPNGEDPVSFLENQIAGEHRHILSSTILDVFQYHFKHFSSKI